MSKSDIKRISALLEGKPLEEVAETISKLIAARDRWYKIAEMYYLCVDGADQEFQKASDNESTK